MDILVLVEVTLLQAFVSRYVGTGTELLLKAVMTSTTLITMDAQVLVQSS